MRGNRTEGWLEGVFLNFIWEWNREVLKNGCYCIFLFVWRKMDEMEIWNALRKWENDKFVCINCKSRCSLLRAVVVWLFLNVWRLNIWLSLERMPFFFLSTMASHEKKRQILQEDSFMCGWEGILQELRLKGYKRWHEPKFRKTIMVLCQGRHVQIRFLLWEM